MPNQRTSRQDSRVSQQRLPRQPGFTIIEMMITIGIVAVIMSLALPSYRTIIEKRQVTSGAEQIGAFLSAARTEAVERNQRVAVNFSRTSSQNWCVGLAANAVACDCTADNCAVDGELRVFNDSHLNYPDIMNSVSGTTSFFFEPTRGMPYQSGEDGAEAHFDGATLELVSQGGSGNYALQVSINTTGRVKICSDEFKPVPGFTKCDRVEEEDS